MTGTTNTDLREDLQALQHQVTDVDKRVSLLEQGVIQLGGRQEKAEGKLDALAQQMHKLLAEMGGLRAGIDTTRNLVILVLTTVLGTVGAIAGTIILQVLRPHG